MSRPKPIARTEETRLSRYVSEYLEAVELTQRLGLWTGPHLLATRDCVDLKKVLPVVLDYFSAHDPQELMGQTLAIHFALLPQIVEATGVPFQLTVGWITRKGRDIFRHDESTLKRFLERKQAAWVAEGMPFHLWLTSPAFEILDLTFALNLGWAKSRAGCQSLVIYRNAQNREPDPVYHPTLVGPVFFEASGAVGMLEDP